LDSGYSDVYVDNQIREGTDDQEPEESGTVPGEVVAMKSP